MVFSSEERNDSCLVADMYCVIECLNDIFPENELLLSLWVELGLNMIDLIRVSRRDGVGWNALVDGAECLDLFQRGVSL